MIDKIEILVPYVYGTNCNAGNIFDTKHKSVLITWEVGTGKSSLLHMIAKSIKINIERKGLGICNSLDESIYIENPSSDLIETPTKRKYFKGLSQVKYEYLFNASLFKIKIGERLLKDFFGHKIKNISRCAMNKPWDLVRYGVKDLDRFAETLNMIAEETKTQKELVYGTAYLIGLGHATRIDNPLTEFFYAKLSGNISSPNLVLDYDLPGQNKRIQDFDTKKIIGSFSSGGFSKGQFQMKKLDTIISQENSIIILDEPFANLSNRLVGEYTKKFIDSSSAKKGKSQYFITSHNESMNVQLRSQRNWVEINLD